jgi:hypothetical protein
VSACSTTGFSSRQTTGALATRGFSYTFNTSSMRSMYASSSFATHHIFSRHGLRSCPSSSTRMVSRPTCGTSCRWTALVAIRRTLQRACPTGGGPQTIATICWLWPGSNRRCLPGRGFSISAASRPSCSKRTAIARTALDESDRFNPTSAAVCPLSNCCSTKARRKTRAD